MAEGAPAWGLRVCLVEASSPMPPRCPLDVRPPWCPAGQSDPCSGSFSQVPKGVCVLEHAEYQVRPASCGERGGGAEGALRAGSWAGSAGGGPAPAMGRRLGGGEAPCGPASPTLPVPEAWVSSLFIQVPELRLHRPQGQRHAAQRHHLHLCALQHHLQPGKQPRPLRAGPAHPDATWPFLFPRQAPTPGVPQGFELVDAPGECCKKCEQTHCIISRPGQHNLVLKVRPPPEPGAKLRPPPPPAGPSTSCLPSGHLSWGFGPSGWLLQVRPPLWDMDCLGTVGRGSLGPSWCRWLCSSGPVGHTWQGGQGAAWGAPTRPHTELPPPCPAARRHEE